MKGLLGKVLVELKEKDKIDVVFFKKVKSLFKSAKGKKLLFWMKKGIGMVFKSKNHACSFFPCKFFQILKKMLVA